MEETPSNTTNDKDENIEVVEKIVDLGWDYDRMSSSGQQVYDEILTILGVQNDT